MEGINNLPRKRVYYIHLVTTKIWPLKLSTEQEQLRSASPWLPNLCSSASPSIAHCTDRPPNRKSPDQQVCLACMPGSRRGGALGGPGRPSVNFTGKLPNLGAHAP
eukprot:1149653-Pelagomonas_calceolata.AAC.2